MMHPSKGHLVEKLIYGERIAFRENDMDFSCGSLSRTMDKCKMVFI